MHVFQSMIINIFHKFDNDKFKKTSNSNMFLKVKGHHLDYYINHL